MFILGRLWRCAIFAVVPILLIAVVFSFFGGPIGALTGGLLGLFFEIALLLLTPRLWIRLVRRELGPLLTSKELALLLPSLKFSALNAGIPSRVPFRVVRSATPWVFGVSGIGGLKQIYMSQGALILWSEERLRQEWRDILMTGNRPLEGVRNLAEGLEYFCFGKELPSSPIRLGIRLIFIWFQGLLHWVSSQPAARGRPDAQSSPLKISYLSI